MIGDKRPKNIRCYDWYECKKVLRKDDIVDPLCFDDRVGILLLVVESILIVLFFAFFNQIIEFVLDFFEKVVTR